MNKMLYNYRYSIGIFFLLILFVLIVVYFSINHSVQVKIDKFKSQVEKLRENKTVEDKLKTFPKYYINLKRHRDRKATLANEMLEYDLTNFFSIEAFDGKNIKDMHKGIIDGYTYINKNDHDCYEAQLAITMSHLKAMIQAKKDNHEMAIIMEDDVRFTLVPHWKKSFEEILDEIPEDCEILLLANRTDQKIEKMELSKTDIKNYNGVAYLITKKGMKKAEKFLSNKNFNFELENIVFDKGMLDQFNVYTYNITLFLLNNYEFESSHDPSFKYSPVKNITSREPLKVVDGVY